MLNIIELYEFWSLRFLKLLEIIVLGEEQSEVFFLIDIGILIIRHRLKFVFIFSENRPHHQGNNRDGVGIVQVSMKVILGQFLFFEDRTIPNLSYQCFLFQRSRNILTKLSDPLFLDLSSQVICFDYHLKRVHQIDFIFIFYFILFLHESLTKLSDPLF